MKYKDKILMQVVTCLSFMALVNGTAMIDNESVKSFKKEIFDQMSVNYTIDDLKVMKDDFIGYMFELPKRINETIIVANEMSYFAYPIDENSSEDIVNVRAAAGGEVVYSGIDKNLGPCVKIKHNDKFSTYGNLHTINVIVGDRVKKSQIIGSYDNKSIEEFYYQLEDSMV